MWATWVAQNEDSVVIQPIACDVRLITGRGRQLFTEWHDETGSVNRWRGVWEPLGKKEFSKRFCKNDEFTQDLLERKVQSLATVVKKFPDNGDTENDKQEARHWAPQGNSLQNKAARVSDEFDLMRHIVEIDCDMGWGWLSAWAWMRRPARKP